MVAIGLQGRREELEHALLLRRVVIVTRVPSATSKRGDSVAPIVHPMSSSKASLLHGGLLEDACQYTIHHATRRITLRVPNYQEFRVVRLNQDQRTLIASRGNRGLLYEYRVPSCLVLIGRPISIVIAISQRAKVARDNVVVLRVTVCRVATLIIDETIVIVKALRVRVYIPSTTNVRRFHATFYPRRLPRSYHVMGPIPLKVITSEVGIAIVATILVVRTRQVPHGQVTIHRPSSNPSIVGHFHPPTFGNRVDIMSNLSKALTCNRGASYHHTFAVPTKL